MYNFYDGGEGVGEEGEEEIEVGTLFNIDGQLSNHDHDTHDDVGGGV